MKSHGEVRQVKLLILFCVVLCIKFIHSDICTHVWAVVAGDLTVVLGLALIFPIFVVLFNNKQPVCLCKSSFSFFVYFSWLWSLFLVFSVYYVFICICMLSFLQWMNPLVAATELGCINDILLTLQYCLSRLNLL